MQSHDIAIIGGGAAGALVAIQLLARADASTRIVLIEPGDTLAQGVAYSTRQPEHLLNVPTGKMSAFAGQPDDFLAFIAARAPRIPRDTLAATYATRREYGLYLQDRLQQAIAAARTRLDHVAARVLDLDRDADGTVLTLDSGATLRATRVVLAAGNTPRPLPARGASALAAPRRVDAWDYAGVAAIPAHADVCIVGTGLSMVDAILTLAANGHRGRIHLLSRHALLPLAHTTAPGSVEVDIGALLAIGLRGRGGRLRGLARAATAQGLPWQAVMERLRPHGQALWRSLPEREQRRFLRHVVRYWDIHRHRVAPEVHARMQALRDSGQLQLHRGRLDMVAAGQRCVQVGARRADGSFLNLDVETVINATGLELRIQAMRNPLLEALVGRGLVRPGPHGVGLASAPDGALIDADGRPQPALRVIGSLRIGDLWETIAVPELRVQAEQIAVDLLGQA
mgnify:CR=1 FL=1